MVKSDGSAEEFPSIATSITAAPSLFVPFDLWHRSFACRYLLVRGPQISCPSQCWSRSELNQWSRTGTARGQANPCALVRFIQGPLTLWRGLFLTSKSPPRSLSRVGQVPRGQPSLNKPPFWSLLLNNSCTVSSVRERFKGLTRVTESFSSGLECLSNSTDPAVVSVWWSWLSWRWMGKEQLILRGSGRPG